MIAAAALDALSAHIAILDETGSIAAVNRAWRRFAESNHPKPATVCVGANYLAVCDAVRGADAEQAATFSAAVRRILKGELDEFALEYPCHSPDERRWFNAHATRFTCQGAMLVVVAHESITGRKLAEESLQRSEERYRSLVDSSLDAVLLTAPDGRVFSANEAACRMFGRSEEELVRVGRSGVVDVSDIRLKPALEERARTGRFQGELTFVRKDGTKFQGEISSAIFAGPEGQLFTSMVIRDISARIQAEGQVQALSEQLRGMAGKIQAAIEKERSHIAREIHDVLAQELTRLKIDLVWLERRLTAPHKTDALETIMDRLAQMKDNVEGAMSCVQKIATELRPPVLDSLGLFAAIEWQARNFQTLTGIECDINAPRDEIIKDPEVSIAVFRVLQEALTNVMRHSNAKRVKILLRIKGSQLVLRIQDNGGGLPLESIDKPTSLGLASMRERALLLGGQFRILGSPRAGTTVEMRVPLSNR
jgi:PAS domain S-box-containing protein